MAPLSFLKSASSPAPRAESPGSSQARNRSPSPEPTTSRYNPARLLRRKPSQSRKQSPQPPRASMDSQPQMPSMVSAGSEVESSEQETEGPQTASSAFFSDIGDLHNTGTGLGFGTTNPAGNGPISEEDGLSSGNAGFSPNRLLGSPRSKREGGIWSGGGTNIMDHIPDVSDSPTPPAWLASASPSSSRRLIDPSEFLMEDRYLEAGPSRRIDKTPKPPSPSTISATNHFYPTALSPPRRPMPRSPQNSRSTPPPLAPALSTSSSFSAFPPDKRPAHTSTSSLDAQTARRPAHRTSSSQGSGLLVDVQEEPKRPIVSAEWLARKPSASKLVRRDSDGADNFGRGNQSLSPFAKRRTPVKARTRPEHARQDSDSQSASQDSDVEVNTGFIGKRRSLNSRDGYEVEVTCDDSQWAGGKDEEGEMTWQVTIRRPRKSVRDDGSNSTASSSSGPGPTNNSTSPLQLSSGRSMTIAPGTASSINLSLSLDQPTGKLVFIAFPMDLHATPKRRGSSSKFTPGPGPPTPPLPPSPRELFTAGSRSQSSSTGTSAPSTRLHTPPPLPTTENAPRTPPPVLPSTPQSRSASRLDRTEYPVTPTRVRLSGQFSPGPGSGNFTSPRSRGSSNVARSLSPAFSGNGNGLITPGTYSTPTSSARRTRLVNAPDLEGGLYAQGTIGGLSEELEGISLSPSEGR